MTSGPTSSTTQKDDEARSFWNAISTLPVAGSVVAFAFLTAMSGSGGDSSRHRRTPGRVPACRPACSPAGMRSRWSVQGGEHAVHPALTCGEPPVVDVLAVSTEALGGSTQLLEIDITRHRHHAGANATDPRRQRPPKRLRHLAAHPPPDANHRPAMRRRQPQQPGKSSLHDTHVAHAGAGDVDGLGAERASSTCGLPLPLGALVALALRRPQRRDRAGARSWRCPDRRSPQRRWEWLDGAGRSGREPVLHRSERRRMCGDLGLGVGSPLVATAREVKSMHPGPVRRRSRWPKAPSCPTLRLVILADLRCS